MTTPSAIARAFIALETIHQADVTWWWRSSKRHDHTYRSHVNEGAREKVKSLTKKYDIEDDTTFCCQWEGHRLTGSNLEQVTAAANELAAYLTKFKGIASLAAFADGTA